MMRSPLRGAALGAMALVAVALAGCGVDGAPERPAPRAAETSDGAVR